MQKQLHGVRRGESEDGREVSRPAPTLHAGQLQDAHAHRRVDLTRTARPAEEDISSICSQGIARGGITSLGCRLSSLYFSLQEHSMLRVAVMVAQVGCAAKSPPTAVALRGQPMQPAQVVEVDTLPDQALLYEGRIVQAVVPKWEIDGDTLVYSDSRVKQVYYLHCGRTGPRQEARRQPALSPVAYGQGAAAWRRGGPRRLPRRSDRGERQRLR